MNEQLIEIFHYHSQKPTAQIIPTATFDDLSLDSLDCIEIVMDVEDKFGIEINDEEMSTWTTFGDVMATVEEKVKKLEAPKEENTPHN